MGRSIKTAKFNKLKEERETSKVKKKKVNKKMYKRKEKKRD